MSAPQPTPAQNERIIETLQISGILVHKVIRGNNIVFKLVDESLISKLSKEQIQYLRAELSKLHMKEIAMAAQIQQQQQQQVPMNSMSKQPVVANRGWPNIPASATGFARSPIAATAAPTTNNSWPVHYQPSNAIDDTSRKIDQRYFVGK